LASAMPKTALITPKGTAPYNNSATSSPLG
jgi:hypothetical protein